MEVKMGKKTQRIIFQIVLAVAVVLLQVLSMRFRFFHEQRLKNLEYGLESGGIMLLMEGFSLLSGFALAWMPCKRLQSEENCQGVTFGYILLLVFTLLLVVIKVLMLGFDLLWSVDFFMTVMSPHSAFGEWVYLTQIPALLAGFSLGRLLRR
jgi:hypothetical protein